MQKRALIVGISGVIGSALAEKLQREGWQVSGLSRGRGAVPQGCRSLTADLTDADAVRAALSQEQPDALFFSVWSRQENEKENVRVNGGMVRNVIDALGERLSGAHVALVTGLKHYLGPFEAYGKGAVPVTPFREEQGRQPVDNFYYAQEDAVFAGAERYGYRWSVHRPHTIIGYALGNAMNMGQTLAVYATLCREKGWPFIFPGSPEQWNGIADVTDAGLMAEQLLWAATAKEAANEDFNAVNGDVFRWNWLWPRLAAYFGIEAAEYPAQMMPLENRMQDAAEAWRKIAAREQLRETDINRLASWWHTDADLGRPMEAFTDMSKSRKAGFTGYRSTLDSFTALFDRLKAENIIPR
ncbi:SDR family oxidoreductase [Pluralibacter gergoviae]|uniref:SDR family oxidoreductase n=1 Tax=Pluralibacter gergoviae TaxID=61647 RepID=A0AAI9DKY7_PLUGE|nr:SDR family oxidoreductase [Pluralibacter gergoviae]EKT9640943.1 SDR family oxidoreductase [Pluralibacter gergoviae]EKV0915540.1 SDR family oxidoreductase [Pluralibacter gergoviae]EKV3543549.1 SDR family oxidoreductase [Pluralibacter gergoviae]EKV9897448.1 SDR family oxidoreductase [Pluralibacter gergoviae]EKV9906785.1 SDR family oxidoreductase [Pluralibacter gergoviae]